MGLNPHYTKPPIQENTKCITVNDLVESTIGFIGSDFNSVCTYSSDNTEDNSSVVSKLSVFTIERVPTLQL